jgi:hypothetical protein
MRLGGLAVGLAIVIAGCAAPPRPTATPLPTPGPAPPGAKPVFIQRRPTPTAVPGSRPPRAATLKLRQEYWLVEAPRADAQRLPVGLLGTQPTWAAKEEVDGWVRIDAGPFTGWAPSNLVEWQG